MSLPAFHYGAWVVEDHKRLVLASLVEDDFRRELKLAYLETKDFDTAFERVKQKLVNKVRAAVS